MATAGVVVATAAVIGVTARASASALRAFLDYYAGVLTLVALTATVAWGLISTDTVVLGSRRRLAAQAVHRATGVTAFGFLLLHIAVKVAERHVRLIESLVPYVPYGARGHALLIGLGTLAGYLLVLALATGALRSAFAGRGRGRAPWWRVLHVCAYPSWFAAITHGLKAGRPAASWVVASYAVCLLAVGGALVARLASPLGRRRRPRPATQPVLQAPKLLSPGPSGDRLTVDRTLCEGHGLCADLLPEIVRLDADGYPVSSAAPLPRHLGDRARRAVRRCPAMALRLERP
ncbi:ferredoxin [Streptomyces sp. RB6PN25]|uniref:Ferredoxin n=1 Tax=Streptomyces humicola TaxID=2953240 RepID=A0ABT1PW86_9ACTN|nr:ferredoxin [Streptomyces humicola]MCQ4081946.1 ferredoxin [Streptomyces humicola]